jgi:hypothetical protein
MTFDEIAVCLIIGFAVPLAILDLVRALSEGRLPVQEDGLQFERRLSPWLITLFAGPGLMVDRLVDLWRARAISRFDVASAVAITVGWAGIYGYVFLNVALVLPAMGA